MKKFKAFTLVETLFAIMVFCIGILVVLLWLSQTLKNQDYANTQIKSAFFAREWIELMFNLRDANYHKELPRNCIFQWESSIDIEDWCKYKFEPWTILKISIWSSDEYIKTEVWTLENDFDKDFETYQIYFHTWSNWFSYDYNWNEDEKTWFARYIKISGVDSNDWPINKNDLLKIESHVYYKRWTLTWDKVMETFIWNYEFNQ